MTLLLDDAGPTTIATHTPGPWKEYAGYIFRPGEDGANICTVSELRADSHVGFTRPEIGSPNAEEIQANARLIAAAPELLASLRDLLNWVEGLPVKHPQQTRQRETAREVIAKATGVTA